jgi:hypothetical protein
MGWPSGRVGLAELHPDAFDPLTTVLSEILTDGKGA